MRGSMLSLLFFHPCPLFGCLTTMCMPDLLPASRSTLCPWPPLPCSSVSPFAPSAGWRFLRKTWSLGRAASPSTTVSSSCPTANAMAGMQWVRGGRWASARESSGAGREAWDTETIDWTPPHYSQGQDMVMVLKKDTLSLFDPLDHGLIHCQLIVNIRVWGVGCNNGRWGRGSAVAWRNCLGLGGGTLCHPAESWGT